MFVFRLIQNTNTGISLRY